MSRRKFLTVIVLTAFGMTNVIADEHTFPIETSGTITSKTVNGKQVLFDIPAGQTLNLPAGTRLWPASPVVISDQSVGYRSTEYNVAEYNVEYVQTREQNYPTSAPSQDTRVFTIKRSDVVDTLASSNEAINPWQHIVDPARVQRVEPTRVERATSSTLTSNESSRSSTDDLEAVAPKTPVPTSDKVAEDVVENAVQSKTTDDIVSTQLGFTPVDNSKIEDLELDKSRFSGTDADGETTEPTQFAADFYAEPNVDLYADSIDPTTVDGETNELAVDSDQSAVPGDESGEPHTISVVASDSVLPTKEPVEAVDFVLADDTVSDETSTTALTGSALQHNEIPMPVFASEKQTESKFSWFLPFVFISALGLVGAERLRRNRKKARFARAMEHGRRVQRLADDETPGGATDTNPAVTQLDKSLQLRTQAATQTIEKTLPESPLAVTESLEETPPPSKTTVMSQATTEKPLLTRPLPPVVTLKDATPTQLPTQPLVTPSEEEFFEVELAEEVNLADVPPMDDSINFVEIQNAAAVAWDDMAGQEEQSELTVGPVDMAEQEEQSELAAGPVEMAEQEEQSELAVPLEVTLPVETQPAPVETAIEPQKTANTDNWVQNMRESEGNVREDGELDQLTGMLEDANAMRAEWSGFEERAVDFRERWADTKKTIEAEPSSNDQAE